LPAGAPAAFQVGPLDHVELFVPERQQAAAWYQRVLGLAPVAGTEAWAADPQGPLMISADGGRTMLALFEGRPPGDRATAGFHRVAFRVDGAGFLEFLRRAPGLALGDLRIMDHATAISIYFDDPFGHHLEVTSYDHEAVRATARAWWHQHGR
jgi:catechol 2,3-dioxygenase-like lactoylglutathione lyase family enzyme